MNTTNLGNAAEAVAAEYLAKLGYIIIECNFKTPRCEIDIVAQASGCVYFVEVKYRGGSGQGTGIEYVTPAKQRQMRYAAETWTNQHEWTGDMTLAAIEVDQNLVVTTFIEDIS